MNNLPNINLSREARAVARAAIAETCRKRGPRCTPDLIYRELWSNEPARYDLEGAQNPDVVPRAWTYRAGVRALAAYLGIDLAAIAAQHPATAENVQTMRRRGARRAVKASQDAAMSARPVSRETQPDTTPAADANTNTPTQEDTNTMSDEQAAMLLDDATMLLDDTASEPTTTLSAGPDGTIIQETHGPEPTRDAILALRRQITAGLMDGDTATLDTVIREALQGPTVRTVTKVVERVVEREAAPVSAPPVGPAGTVKARDVFGAAACAWAGDLDLARYNDTSAPAIDPHYIWPARFPFALSCLADCSPIYLHGPAGTGKTTLAEQMAAHLGRPFVRIACTNTTEGVELTGQTVPHPEHGHVWKDGALAAAVRIPGCVVLIDEPSIARAGAIMVLQSVLESGPQRALTIADTGERIALAPHVLIIFADNTNGTGDSTGRYEDTGRLNAATRNRFGAYIRVSYLDAAREAKMLAARSGAPIALARILVDFAHLTRQQTGAGLTEGVGPRPLVALARHLLRGAPVQEACEVSILDRESDSDRAILDALCKSKLDDASIARSLSSR